MSVAKKRVVLLTGASAGIGASLARELASQGFDLVLTARREDRLNQLAEELRGLAAENAKEQAGQEPIDVHVVALALDDATAPERLVTETIARFGRLDVLINNAGFGLPTLFADSDLTEVRPSARGELRRAVDAGTACPAPPARKSWHDHQCRFGDQLPGQLGSGGLRRDQGGTRVLERCAATRAATQRVRVCLVEPGPVKTEFFSALEKLAPENGAYNPLLDAPAPWMSAPVDVVARRIVRLIDHPQRRLSVPRRFVWPWRMVGGLFRIWPWLGDLGLSTMTRHFDKKGDLNRSPSRSPSVMFARLNDLLGMIKFSHTLFALPFALLGAALAAHTPEGWVGRPRDWLGILLCMASGRSAAMAFNRLADRRIDALNPRTASRHLPSGQLSVASVVGFTVAC